MDPCTKLIYHDLLEKEKSVQSKSSHSFLSFVHVGACECSQADLRGVTPETRPI